MPHENFAVGEHRGTTKFVKDNVDMQRLAHRRERGFIYFSFKPVKSTVLWRTSFLY